MNIEIGQIWERKPPPDGMFFPAGSWKIKILGFEKGKISNKMIEYNGEVRDGDISLMTKETLLQSYELVSIPK